MEMARLNIVHQFTGQRLNEPRTLNIEPRTVTKFDSIFWSVRTSQDAGNAVGS